MPPPPSSETTKVLITVMTYPHPSKSYNELVCTAGVTEAGEWVRLYPVDYRYRPPAQRFVKYQWIELGLAPRGSNNDTRPESRAPDLDSIRLVGERLTPADGWKARREVVDRLPVYTKRQLEALYKERHLSLGVLRPTEVLDMEVSPNDEPWSSGQQGALDQFRLFGDQPKPLEKIPYRFTYVFRCEDSKKLHRASVTDWELGQLFRNVRDTHESEERAKEDVVKKYLGQMCDPKIDTRLFMGTIARTPTWICVGVFWPPKPLPPPPPSAQGAFEFETVERSRP